MLKSSKIHIVCSLCFRFFWFSSFFLCFSDVFSFQIFDVGPKILNDLQNLSQSLFKCWELVGWPRWAWRGCGLSKNKMGSALASNLASASWTTLASEAVWSNGHCAYAIVEISMVRILYSSRGRQGRASIRGYSWGLCTPSRATAWCRAFTYCP